MNKEIELLYDKRFNKTLNYIITKQGSPVYKKRAFKYIDKVLGPQYKWINKSPQEYFSSDVNTEALQAIKIFNFKEDLSFKDIKDIYLNLSKRWHPDKGGHASAFNILNYAFILFKNIYEKEDNNWTV